MIQLVINSNLLRELDENRLLKTYARLVFINNEDLEDDIKIRDNLIKILDWDVYGDKGLGLYCSNFETLKRRDWDVLVQCIKDNKLSIIRYAKEPSQKEIAEKKEVLDFINKKELKKKEFFTNVNYTVTKKGKKARSCIYEGRVYKSRQECRYKEGISQSKLYRYLEKTGQV